MAGTILVILAFVLDWAIGDPRGIPHPVVVMGRLISALEKLFYRASSRPGVQVFWGALLAVLVIATSCGFFAILDYFTSPWPWLWWPLSIWFAGSTLAARGLADAGRAIALPLANGDLSGARQALSMIVSRDCQELTQQGVVRGAVESVAENTSDGLVAPLFYLALGGVPLAMAYKAVNTLDSMLGYKNSRYLWFGRAAAHIDDFANWLPARLTALLLVAAAVLERKDWRNAWRILVRDGGKHSSPNSGLPEAAVAGALGVALGGESCYFGQVTAWPQLGEAINPLAPQHIEEAVALMRTAYTLALIGFMALRMVIGWLL